MRCSVCNKSLILLLDPDYTSSGVWCYECGVGFANPKESFPTVPSRLFDLVEGWNIVWEHMYDNRNKLGNKEYCVDLLVNMAEELREQINKYIPCLLKLKLDNKLYMYNKCEEEV